jgi:hypothetical protein
MSLKRFGFPELAPMDTDFIFILFILFYDFSKIPFALLKQIFKSLKYAHLKILTYINFFPHYFHRTAQSSGIIPS